MANPLQATRPTPPVLHWLVILRPASKKALALGAGGRTSGAPLLAWR